MRRWSAAARAKLLGKKPPTLENRTKAIAKLTQKTFDEMCAKGDLRSTHGAVTNRQQTNLRVKFLLNCTKETLQALAAFESKRALLQLAHLDSPLTQDFLLGRGSIDDALHLSEQELWKTPAWQLECVRLYDERFFNRNCKRPFASATICAHVARVQDGVLKSIEDFATKCDGAVLPKVVGRQEQIRDGDFDAELHAFSLQLLKNGMEEFEIPAAAYPGFSVISEMFGWQAQQQRAAQELTKGDMAAEVKQEALVEATRAAGSAALEKFEQLRQEWTGLDTDSQERQVTQLNHVYQNALLRKAESVAVEKARETLQKIKIFKTPEELKLYMEQLGHTARVITVDLTQDEASQYVEKCGEYSWRYPKTKPLRKDLRAKLVRAVEAPPKGQTGQLLLRVGDHSLDVRHAFPYKSRFVVPLTLTSKDQGYLARGTLKRPFSAEGRTEVTFEYWTVGARSTAFPANFQNPDADSEDEEELPESDDDEGPGFCPAQDPQPQPRLGNDAKLKVEDGRDLTVYRRTECSHHVIKDALRVVCSTRKEKPTATEACVVICTGTAEAAAAAAVSKFEHVYVLDLGTMLGGVEEQWPHFAKALAPMYLPAKGADGHWEGGQEYHIDEQGGLALRSRKRPATEPIPAPEKPVKRAKVMKKRTKTKGKKTSKADLEAEVKKLRKMTKEPLEDREAHEAD